MQIMNQHFLVRYEK